MLYTAFICLTGAYLLSVLISALVLRELVPEKTFRWLLIVVAFLALPTSIWVLIKSVFVKPKPAQFSAELARIEDEIERERVQIFGGQPVHPSLGERWKVAYLTALEKSALKLQKHQTLGAARAAASH